MPSVGIELRPRSLEGVDVKSVTNGDIQLHRLECETSRSCGVGAGANFGNSGIYVV